ncbi:hypothetical protein KDU71_02740 [Carboxylicivirga sediminis]|uniref:Aldose 1-epimerase n=1 Tax=Carboxylicivirga sediminis TaxID=2006564 RepID=A0A941IXA6_9BACT|nr:hypothetical protein [Carboxylicivirga sediminis]MBR8534462.1 hypothetical protein [Carboxylicivirga sediminis]
MIELAKGHIRMLFEEPGENYLGTRFDWTGKLVQMWWKEVPLCTTEMINSTANQQGKGFFNEFGIDEAIGYSECGIGELFPKIGVGHLKKESDTPYSFAGHYPVMPFQMSFEYNHDSVTFQCINRQVPFPFTLNKTFTIKNDGFIIDYQLQNIGEKVFETTEYVHNFLSPGQKLLSDDIHLSVGTGVDMNQFNAGLNPGGILASNGYLQFTQTPQSDFFFEYIAEPSDGGQNWCISDKQLNLSISESTDFKPCKINLWGRAHVVSPELFKNINLQPGATERWQRVFEIKEI